ncbi:unnamed protein product [Mytilus coruscus]|uniref:Uncharacterized protein n=1 Tax=Mytilus coruscus TaxID=42192 RepID=A0A6J8D4Q0_MYTCO|nr:unnamed protein product [Mytilus coruscus]
MPVPFALTLPLKPSTAKIMDRTFQIMKVLCVLFAVDIGSKLRLANAAFIGTNFNSSTESTKNEETSSEISTIYNNVTLTYSMSAETTFVISKDNVTSTIIYRCSFEIIDVGIRQQVQSYVAQSKELIFLHFYLLNQTTALSYGPNDTIYNIFTIVRTAGGFGNELLAMHPQFEQFSIGTLMFGVEHVNIPLRVMALECFKQKELQHTLLKIVKKDLGLLQKRNDGSHASLCQTHVEDVRGLASFYYNCCTVENNDEFVCNRLETNLWMDVLLVGMNICYVIVFLFSPLLIPTSWYKADIHGITLRIERTFNLKLSDEFYTENQMETEQKTVQLLRSQCNSPLKVKEINLKVLEINTVSTDYVPAGIFHYLYRTFIKCHVKDHEYVKDCCHTDICKFRFCILLNASSVLTYVTFGGMLLFYVYDTLRNVKKKYEAFSQAVIDFSVFDMQKQVMETFKNEKEIKYSAFQFKILNEGSINSNIQIEFDETCNRLLLKSNYPCLFFDENSKPYLNEKAFFRMCFMKVLRAPGSLWENYKKAAFNFLIILLFLIFVVIIVLAFGKTQGFSGTYQAIATLGDGLIPLILRRYFFKSDDVFDFKSDHFLLFEELKQLFENYCETWEIVDIPKDVIADSSDNDEMNYETLFITKSQSKATEDLEPTGKFGKQVNPSKFLPIKCTHF